MQFTEQGIEDAVQWTIIVIAVVSCASVIFTIGTVLNQSLMSTGVL